MKKRKGETIYAKTNHEKSSMLYHGHHDGGGKLPGNVPERIIGENRICSSLKKIEIPTGVTSIGAYAFYGCSGLKKVEIPSSVTSIGYRAFEECSSLTEIIIPAGVTDIERFALGYYTAKDSENNESYTTLEGLTIYGYPDSDAKRYAGENDLTFVDLTGVLIGWQIKDTGMYYYNKNGTVYTGWLNLDNKWYYFNKGGLMQTGWQKLGGKWYYLNSDGVMATGWKQVDGKWYYLSGSGVMQTGWKLISNKWYYFASNGVMKTGWQEIGGKTYYFKNSGAMASKEWCKGYWLNGNGTWTYKPKASWVKDDNGWKYVDTSGWFEKNSTVIIDGKSYTFDADGYMK